MSAKQNKIRISVETGRLPYAEHAWIDERKLTEYALDPDKSEKARGFAVKLDFYREDWAYLHDQIIERITHATVYKICLRTSTKWPEFTVLIPIDGHNGKSCPVSTGWMVDDRHEPWLTTLHVVKHAGGRND